MKAWWCALLLLLAPAPALGDPYVRILADGWTPADERGYGEFVAGIGASGCRTGPHQQLFVWQLATQAAGPRISEPALFEPPGQRPSSPLPQVPL